MPRTNKKSIRRHGKGSASNKFRVNSYRAARMRYMKSGGDNNGYNMNREDQQTMNREDEQNMNREDDYDRDEQDMNNGNEDNYNDDIKQDMSPEIDENPHSYEPITVPIIPVEAPEGWFSKLFSRINIFKGGKSRRRHTKGKATRKRSSKRGK